jgi:hypothetical protein
MFSAGPSAGGIWDSGLGEHCGAGAAPVIGPDVTWQVNDTGLSKPEPGLTPRSTVAVAVPPGTTAVAGVSCETERVNWPCARDTDATESIESNETKMIARATRLGFTMNG